MIKKIDLYLLKSFFSALIVVTLGFGLTIIIINVIEELRDFVDHQVPLVQIIEYYFYWSGWVIKSFLPMFVLIASLFSVSLLARRNEILAMKASGFSLYRISLPFMVVALLLAGGHFYYNEYIFPPANKKRLEIKEYTIEKKSRTSGTHITNIYRQVHPDYFYTLNNFNALRMEGRDLKICITDNDRLSKIITAETIVYRTDKWMARNGVERTFTKTGEEDYREFEVMMLPDIEEVPEDFTKKIGKPEDMGLDELKKYIDLMKRTGGPYIRESVDLGLKYSFPVTIFIVMLISIPISSNPRRGGVAVSIAIGAMISLIYFILFRVMQSAGYNEKLPLEVAVWGVNGLFFLVGLIAMFKSRK